MTKHPLTQYRERAGLSQGQVAKQVGVTKWTITSIETGRRTPSFALVSKLVKASNGMLKADDFLPADRAA